MLERTIQKSRYANMRIMRCGDGRVVEDGLIVLDCWCVTGLGIVSLGKAFAFFFLALLLFLALPLVIVALFTFATLFFKSSILNAAIII